MQKKRRIRISKIESKMHNMGGQVSVIYSLVHILLEIDYADLVSRYHRSNLLEILNDKILELRMNMNNIHHILKI